MFRLLLFIWYNCLQNEQLRSGAQLLACKLSIRMAAASNTLIPCQECLEVTRQHGDMSCHAQICGSLWCLFGQLCSNLHIVDAIHLKHGELYGTIPSCSFPGILCINCNSRNGKCQPASSLSFQMVISAAAFHSLHFADCQGVPDHLRCISSLLLPLQLQHLSYSAANCSSVLLAS